MLTLTLIFVLTASSLALLFWVGGLFLQSYLYTQPSENLYWQAPAAGLLLGVYITIWCSFTLLSKSADMNNIPYDTLFRFNAEEDMAAKPAKEIKVIPRKKGEPPIVYKRKGKGDGRDEYRNDSSKPWERDLQAVIVEHDGEEYRFEPVKTGEGEYGRYVSTKGGWSLTINENGTTNGRPTAFRLGRFLANITLNFLYLGVCIGAMLLLRFMPGHAMLLAVVLWLLTTLVLLPMLFSYSAAESHKRRVGEQPAQKKAALLTITATPM